MSSEDEDDTYTIGELSKKTGVPVPLLREWEKHFTQLDPIRLANGHRLYDEKHVNIVRRIKTLVQHEGMSYKGAYERIRIEEIELGSLRNKHEIRALLDKIADEARAIIGLFDPDDTPDEEIGE